MFLLDTNVLSELRRPERAHPAVAQWAGSIPVTEFFVSAISVLEVERGALRMARKDAAQGKVLKAWIDAQVLGRFDGRILPVDAAVALRCAPLHVPDPKPERDALIAATALVHGLAVVTRNVEDFASFGARLLNPWEEQP
ncbi:MAG: type II toxin-antitoxin system VapC family toxin [Alphaproteobacteria bacterium]|nr:type II toxin-antitoxin system VapC family toxin [Alphaproteobacteria bacterium]